MFAAWPMVVLINGTSYVRSIRQVNVDGSLSLFCAIENGLVLRVATGVELASNLEQAFAGVRGEIGALQAVLACDCIERRLEMERTGEAARVGQILTDHHVVGFNTFGEQYQGLHMNRTLVGIAFGAPGERGVAHG